MSDPAGHFKLCPRCKAPSALSATFCAKCGRRYKTTSRPAFPWVLVVAVAVASLTLGGAGATLFWWQAGQARNLAPSPDIAAAPIPPPVAQNTGSTQPTSEPPPAPAIDPVTAPASMDPSATAQPPADVTPPQPSAGQLKFARTSPAGDAIMTPRPVGQAPDGWQRDYGRPSAARGEPDNLGFDKYLRWLRFVEQERAGLRAQGETVAFQQMEDALKKLPANDPNRAVLMRQNRQVISQTIQALRAFRNNIAKSRQTLTVPSDCKTLDAFYVSALDQETETTGRLLLAIANENEGQIRSIGKDGVGSIDMNLGQANRELKKVYEGRRLSQLFTIETGGNSSLLGGMTGIGGSR